MSLTPILQKAKDEIEGYARGHGLDFFETIFEQVDYDELNEVAAYGGFPNRYPHWRFGMEYDQLAKGYEYGLQKIYELVINNDPCYAYLMRSNSLVDQKLVMAHVYGHCDFFKNNCWFAHTDRKMVDRMANHGTSIRRLADRFGIDRVEKFVDLCLSIDNLIDIHAPHIRRAGPHPSETSQDEDGSVARLPSKGYMDSFINPPEVLKEEMRQKASEDSDKKGRFPANPQRDVLAFLLHFAPLERWEQEILEIIRDEAYYFAPQGQTKIMNEGWASFWHSTIMTQQVLSDSEVIDFADHHAGTMATQPGQINPYKVGIELLRDIEERWDRGQFGKDWEECDDYEEQRLWNKKLGLGRKKIFDVRRTHNDVTFIDAFLSQPFCDAQKLFVYGTNPKTGKREIVSRDYRMVKEQILFGITNFGQPYIEIVDANFANRGELLLCHRFSGLELQLDEASDTLRNLQLLWRRPVHVQTYLDQKPILLSFDGNSVIQKEIDALEDSANGARPEYKAGSSMA